MTVTVSLPLPFRTVRLSRASCETEVTTGEALASSVVEGLSDVPEVRPSEVAVVSRLDEPSEPLSEPWEAKYTTMAMIATMTMSMNRSFGEHPREGLRPVPGAPPPDPPPGATPPDSPPDVQEVSLQSCRSSRRHLLPGRRCWR